MTGALVGPELLLESMHPGTGAEPAAAQRRDDFGNLFLLDGGDAEDDEAAATIDNRAASNSDGGAYSRGRDLVDPASCWARSESTRCAAARTCGLGSPSARRSPVRDGSSPTAPSATTASSRVSASGLFKASSSAGTASGAAILPKPQAAVRCTRTSSSTQASAQGV